MTTATTTTTTTMKTKTAQVQQQLHQSNIRPWYTYVTLDLLLQVLARSVFHPAITLIFYLCLAAMHKHRTWLAYYTLYWAAFLSVVEVVIYLNHRVAYGWPRKVDWANEVVVITGGGSGLGRVLAEMLMVSKGVRVAILDLKDPDEEASEWIEGRGGLCWKVCDVSDLESVQRAAEEVKEEMGSPTILINNAAMPVNGLPLIPSLDLDVKTLTAEQASKTFQVNTLSHFNTLTTFLPLLLNSEQGGHIITISSILAHLSPSRLSDYAASKAALTSLHNSLKHEISTHPSPKVRKSIKTVLVEPGMMDTQLFAGITSVPWYANFFGPVLDIKDMAREIINVVERGDSGVIRMPAYCAFMPLYGSMPATVQKFMRWFAGIDKAIVASKDGGR